MCKVSLDWPSVKRDIVVDAIDGTESICISLIAIMAGRMDMVDMAVTVIIVMDAIGVISLIRILVQNIIMDIMDIMGIMDTMGIMGTRVVISDHQPLAQDPGVTIHVTYRHVTLDRWQDHGCVGALEKVIHLPHLVAAPE